VGDKLRISLDTGSQAVLKLQGSASKQVSSDHNDKGIISGFTTITKIPDYAYYLVPATIDVAGLYPTSLSNNTIVKDGRGRFRVASFQINNPSNTNITLIRAAFLDKGSHSTSSEYTLMISDSFPQNITFGSEVGTTYSYKKTTATSSTWVIDFNSLSNSTGLVIGKGRVVYVTVLRNQYPTEYENWNLFTEPFFDNMPFFSLQYRVNEKDLQKTFQTLTDSEDATINSLIIDNVPVARIVDMLITYAYQDKASDIHIEPEEKDSRKKK
jgi:type II secretory ATPase GspE/PulE/Tfp pilus assembly ATPase PilB-like protein